MQTTPARLRHLGALLLVGASASTATAAGPGPVLPRSFPPAPAPRVDPALIDGRPGCLGVTPGGGTAIFLVETLRVPGGLEREVRPINPAGDDLPELAAWSQSLFSCESSALSPEAVRQECAPRLAAALAQQLPPLREQIRAARLQPCIPAEAPTYPLRLDGRTLRLEPRPLPEGGLAVLGRWRLSELSSARDEPEPLEPDGGDSPVAHPPATVLPQRTVETQLRGAYTGAVARSLFLEFRQLSVAPLLDDARTTVQAVWTTTVRSTTWRELGLDRCRPGAGRPRYPSLARLQQEPPEPYRSTDPEDSPFVCRGLTPDGRAGWFHVGEHDWHVGGADGEFVEASRWRDVLLGDRRLLGPGRPRGAGLCLETEPAGPFQVLGRQGRLVGSYVVLDDGEPTWITELQDCSGPGDCGVKESFRRLYHLPGGPSLFFEVEGQNTGYQSHRIAALTAEELGLTGCAARAAAVPPPASPAPPPEPAASLELRGGLVVRAEPADAELEVHGPLLTAPGQGAPPPPPFLDRRGVPWFRHGLLPGRYRVRVSRTGWLPVTREPEVRPWETTTVALRLEAEPARPPTAEPIPLPWIALHGGTFEMGRSWGGGNPPRNERPRHLVTLAPFEILKTEVTLGMYQSCVQAGRCTPPRFDPEHCPAPAAGGAALDAAGSGGAAPGPAPDPQHPVGCVDWDQARAFARWVGGGSRLCSEAEWEYAARSAGRTQARPWGNQLPSCQRVIMHDRSTTEPSLGARPIAGCGREQSWPVCSRPAGHSSQGGCDLMGNVAEWVEDRYHPDYQGAPRDGSAWLVGPGDQRVIRGSSWETDWFADEFGEDQDGHKATRRFYAAAGQVSSAVGFRLCRSR